MKIALVIYRYSGSRGGVERYVWNLARGLVSRGHEVHVFCSRQDAAQTGVKIHRVPAPHFWSPIRRLAFAANSKRLLQRESFDIIHGFGRTYYQDVYRASWGTHMDFLRATYPLMRKPLGALLYLWNPKHLVALWLDKKIYSPGSFKVMSCVSRVCMNQIVSRFPVDSSHVHVVYNGVDLDEFSPSKRGVLGPAVRARLGAPADSTVILFAGSDFRRKGLRHLLQAVARMRQASNLRVLVVGRNRWKEMKALAERLQIADIVHFVGRSGNISEFYAAADMFVLPTLYDAFPNVCLEAMASGLPVITTRASGTSEIMTDGEDGFVIDQGSDLSALVERIKQLLDPLLRRRMGDRARKTAEKYTIDLNVEETIKLYEEALSVGIERGAEPAGCRPG